MEVRYYDPAVHGRDEEPEPADLISCIDVLEHIEPEKLRAVLDHIHSLMERVGYFVIALRPAEKRLPDGRNAHLIIDNAHWWLDRLRELSWDVKRHAYTGDELIVWVKRR
jgi:predicted SAM-dependent methyltransferase